jgi:hypothetical protein
MIRENVTLIQSVDNVGDIYGSYIISCTDRVKRKVSNEDATAALNIGIFESLEKRDERITHAVMMSLKDFREYYG